MLRITFLAPAVAGALLTLQNPDATFDGSSPVLRIDGTTINADEYVHWLVETGASRFGQDFAERWAIRRAVAESGIELPQADVEALVSEQIDRRIEHAFRGEKAGWLNELKRAGRSEPGYRVQQVMYLTPEQECKALVAADRVVPEAKIVRDWELDYGPAGRDMSFTAIKFQVEVLTPPPGSSPEQLERNRKEAFAEKEALALQVRERALAGEDMAALARQFSEDTQSRQDDGRLLHFRRAGWPHDAVDALLELELGEISEPIYAKGGWWLMRLDEAHETPLEEARDWVVAKLIAKGPEQDEVGNKWNELTEDVYFELRPALFGEGPVDPEGGEPVGMVVDGEEIPVRVVADWLMKVRGEWQARYFAERWLVERRAREMGVVVTPEQAEERAQRRLEWSLANNPTFHGSREIWLAHLSATGRRYEDFMREMRYHETLSAMVEELILLEREVTDEMVQEEFERQFGPDGRWIEARMIQVDVELPNLRADVSREEMDGLMAAALVRAREKAEDVVRRIEEGEDFASIARKESDEPISAAAGGRLEGRFRPDAWSQDVAKAVLGLAVGEVSAPILDGTKLRIFEVTGVRTVTLEEARAELEAELQERRPTEGDLAAYRNVILRDVEIEVLPGMYE